MHPCAARVNGVKEAKMPPGSSPSLEAALQAARQVAKATGQTGNSVAPFALQQQISVAAGSSEFMEALGSHGPAGSACMQAVVAPRSDPSLLMTRAHLEEALSKLNSLEAPPNLPAAASIASAQSSPNLAQAFNSVLPPEASPVASQGLPSGQADMSAIAAQLVDYENEVAVSEAMVKISQHKKRLRELELEYNLNIASEILPQQADGSYSTPVCVHELLTSSESIEDPAVAAIAVRALLWGGGYAQEPVQTCTTLAASEDAGYSSGSALPAAAPSGLSVLAPSGLPAEGAFVLSEQLPSLSPHRVSTAHDGSVALKGITNMAGTILSTCADDRYPSHSAVLVAIQDLPGLQPWMYTVQPLKLVLPTERVYDEHGLLPFPSVDDFVEQPSSSASMTKQAGFDLLQSGGLFNFLGTAQVQVGVVTAEILQNFKLLGNLRMKLHEACPPRHRRGLREGPQLNRCCGRRARWLPLCALGCSGGGTLGRGCVLHYRRERGPRWWCGWLVRCTSCSRWGSSLLLSRGLALLGSRSLRGGFVVSLLCCRTDRGAGRARDGVHHL